LLNRALGGRISRRAMMFASQARELGNFSSARAACDLVLALEPDLGEALMLSAYLDLPGPDYIAVLGHIHQVLQPRTYLEVGVDTGSSLRLAAPHTRAIGVDPAPKIREPLGANVTVLTAPSDEAFARFDFRKAFSGLPVDLAFIDGMHNCEFALRDFMNIERMCTRTSTVLIHDCYPLNRLTAERKRQTVFWSGDTWRMVPILKKHRPDLRLSTIATAPTGLAIVRGLDPDSRVLHERYDAIEAEMLAQDFSVLERSKPQTLNRCANDWREISAALAA
jgi:hypothetical protein